MLLANHLMANPQGVELKQTLQKCFNFKKLALKYLSAVTEGSAGEVSPQSPAGLAGRDLWRSG